MSNLWLDTTEKAFYVESTHVNSPSTNNIKDERTKAIEQVINQYHLSDQISTFDFIRWHIEDNPPQHVLYLIDEAQRMERKNNEHNKIDNRLSKLSSESRYRKRLEHGYRSKDPEIVLHDLPLALFEEKKLEKWKILENSTIDLSEPSNSDVGWFILKTSQGKIVAHKSFLQIMDNFNQLVELEKTDTNSLDASKTLELLRRYHTTMAEYRKRHNEIFEKALSSLSEDKQSKIREVISGITDFNMNNIPDVVAIPFYEDNPSLWIDFYQLTKEQRQGIGEWFLINSGNLLFASEKNLRNFNYFHYALGQVRRGNAASTENKLQMTARHEGSHGIINKIMNKLIVPDVSQDNPLVADPLSEGLASCMGKDGKYTEKTMFPLTDLLQNPLPAKKDVAEDIAYQAAPKFFMAIYTILQQREQIGQSEEKEKELWTFIVKAMLETALEQQMNTKLKTQSQNERLVAFFKTLIDNLQINKQELTDTYINLN